MLSLNNLNFQPPGAKFDLKAFHDEVLKLGNAPLYVLEQHIDNWRKNIISDDQGSSTTLAYDGLCMFIVLYTGYLLN